MRRDRTFQGSDGAFHLVDWGGDGPPAHIAHATGFCAGVYSPLAGLLTDRIHLLGMDDRGHGRTTAPADPRALQDWDPFADDLVRLFAAQGEPVIALGHSRGGVASLMVAIERPELVRALVLIDPTILPLEFMPLWFVLKKLRVARFFPIAARAAKRQRCWPDRKTLHDAYCDKPTFSDWQEGFLDGYLDDGAEELPDGSVSLLCDPRWESRCFAVCPHDVWLHIPRLRCPTLVLYGETTDTFRPEAVQRFRKVVPHAVMQGFADTGHFVPMQRPAETAAAITDFLRDQRII